MPIAPAVKKELMSSTRIAITMIAPASTSRCWRICGHSCSMTSGGISPGSVTAGSSEAKSEPKMIRMAAPRITSAAIRVRTKLKRKGSAMMRFFFHVSKPFLKTEPSSSTMQTHPS